MYRRIKKGDRNTTISNARYIYQTHHRVLLTRDQEVDHIDNDPLNDAVENLQVLTGKENRRKSAIFANHGLEVAVIRCCVCQSIFKRRKGKTFLVPSKKNDHTVCSKKCVGRLTKIRLEVKDPLSYLVRVERKHDYAPLS